MIGWEEIQTFAQTHAAADVIGETLNDHAR